MRRPLYDPWEIYRSDEEIRQAVQLIECDFFSMMEPGIFKPLTWSLLDGGDRYMLLADLRDYIRAQERVNEAYQECAVWCRKAIANVACAGRFSSDRTISEYAFQIWHLDPCQVAPVQ